MAQGAILETRDQIPRWAPGAWSLLLPLPMSLPLSLCCLLYTSDAADDLLCVDLGGRRIIKKKKKFISIYLLRRIWNLCKYLAA